MPTFNESLQASWEQGYYQTSPPHSPGFWLLMLKDNIQQDSPEFGMMSLMLNPELGTCTGTFVYADQSEDISYQMEWSFREHDDAKGRQRQRPEIFGISLEYPGESPVVFLGLCMTENPPDCS